MARMLDALRRLEAANLLVAPSAPATPAPVADSALATIELEQTPTGVVELDDPPFEPTIGPLVSWERGDEQLAYHSHAIDDALDELDDLADDVAESISPTRLVTQPMPDSGGSLQTSDDSGTLENSATVAESPAASATDLLDEFDPSQVLREHQEENGETVTIVGLSDAPAVAADVLSTIQFAEHWATIALGEFGIDAAPPPEPQATIEDFALAPEPPTVAPAAPPEPIAEVAPPPAIVAPPRVVKAPAPAEPEKSNAAELEIVPRPSPSPAELAALLDLNDRTLLAQYAQLGERILSDLKSTTKACAALLSVEHQPHVTDVTLRTAMMICRGGKQVLVIDASLADKHLTGGLGMPVEFGLAEVLKGRVPWQQAVRATATPGLCVLPAGRLTPPRLADDDHRLKDVLKELTSQWDLVLLDGGSLAESSAQYVAAAARNVYLVVRLGETDADAAQQAARSLAAPEIALRGCIVTNDRE